MKKILLIVAGLFILTSCASSDQLAEQSYTVWRCSDSPNCSIVGTHNHAW